jgi:hypothetical protein
MLARFGPGAELLDNGWRCRGYNLKDMIIEEVSAPALGNATDLGAN